MLGRQNSDDSDAEKNDSDMDVSDVTFSAKPSSSGGKTIAKEEKKRKCGIIYLSTLPEFMTVAKTRNIFNLYGEIGRIYLQPADADEKNEKKKKRKNKFVRNFTEGWVEFKSKRVAKHVALQLNNTRIEGKKRSKFYDVLWNIKYLPRFKWIHLNERLAYERAVHKQRLRNEIAQAKREANFLSHNIEISEKLKKKKKLNSSGGTDTASDMNTFVNTYHQRKTDKEIFEESENKKLKNETMMDEDESDDGDRKHFLKKLFG